MSTGKIKKTKQVFLDAARQVFAKLGVSGATMNDIAEASKKGRRTLYLYFSNKEEIYYALVEQEMGIVVDKLEEVAAKTDISEGEKLVEYIYMHLDCMKDLVERNGTLRADFFNDIKTVETLRRPIDVREIRQIRNILRKGVASGEFDVPDADVAANMILYALKGLEGPYNRQKLAVRMAEHREEIAKMIMRAIRKLPSAAAPADKPIPVPENNSDDKPDIPDAD